MHAAAKRAIVLAAGLGTRLAPLTDRCPKPMLPVAGVPLLERILRLLRVHGFTEVCVNLHHLPGAVQDHFGDGRALDLALRYNVEPELLGTAGALNAFRDFVDRPVLVYYGDVYTDTDLSFLWNAHARSGALATLGLYRVEDPTRCGIVELEEEGSGGGGRIVRFQEKPRPEEVFTNLANAGLYVIEPEVLAHIPPQGPCDFGRDVFPALLAQGLLLRGQELGGNIIDIGTMPNYRLVQTLYTAPRGAI